MKEITRINHIGIRVADLDIARRFYEKLGFEFIAGPHWPRTRRHYGASFRRKYQLYPKCLKKPDSQYAHGYPRKIYRLYPYGARNKRYASHASAS